VAKIVTDTFAHLFKIIDYCLDDCSLLLSGVNTGSKS